MELEHTMILVKAMILVGGGLVAIAAGGCMLTAGVNAIWHLMLGDVHRLMA